MHYFDVYNFDYRKLMGFDILDNPKKDEPDYIVNSVNCFDIEATNLDEYEQAVMYAWKIAIDEKYIIGGRTWEDFTYFINKVDETVPDGMLYVIYVHNLSYEFNWLHSVLDLHGEDIFAVDKRKVLKFTYKNKIVFRCSYLWSNLSLKSLTAKYNVKHKKLSGDEYDYSKRRFWFTELSEQEEEYQIHDVLGVVESLKTAMRLDGDTLVTIPATSTGYPRRDVRESLYDNKKMYGYIHRLLPASYDQYKLLRAAFRGGNTHANRYVVGDMRNDMRIETLENIKSVDMASCYPAVLLNEKYPGAQFKEILKCEQCNIDDQIRANRAVIMHVTFYDLTLRNPMYPCPYISYDRCTDIPMYETTVNGEIYNIEGARCDNGRVMQADVCSLALTDIDYTIINKQYTYTKMEVHKAYSAPYKKLPEEFKRVVRKYFADKTLLKGETGEKAILYSKSKALLNALFGMCAMDAVKEDIIYDIVDDERLEHDFRTKSEKIFAEWEKSHPDADPVTFRKMLLEIRDKVFQGIFAEYLTPRSRKHGFLPYQWGVYCTAHARKYLQDGIDYVYEHTDYLKGVYFVYCDTDSIYYKDDLDVIHWDNINAERRQKAINNGGMAVDRKGKKYYLGIYEQELGVKIKGTNHIKCAERFKVMGAKKYAYETPNKQCFNCPKFRKSCWGDLHITIAGVGKTAGADYLNYLADLEQEKGHNITGLDLIYDGFKFPAKYYNKYEKRDKPAGGGTLAKYNDDTDMYIEVDGHDVHIISNVYLADNFKTIGRASEYRELTNLCAMCEIYLNTIDKDVYI